MEIILILMLLWGLTAPKKKPAEPYDIGHDKDLQKLMKESRARRKSFEKSMKETDRVLKQCAKDGLI
jgi:hypothetical protein